MTEATLLERIVQPDHGDMGVPIARAILRMEFPADDLSRMHALATRNQEGKLSRQERSELDIYRRIGLFVDLLQAKARLTLKKKKPRAMKNGRGPG